MKDGFIAFLRTSMLCGDIRNEMVEYKICFLTADVSHFEVYFSHVVDNTGDERSGAGTSS